MDYYPAFICGNGHAVSTLSNYCSDNFCSKCGAALISKCPDCGNTIKGRSVEFGGLTDYTVPAYCRFCGKPYPWTKAAIEATMYMLQESELSDEEQRKLIEVLPDVIAETPKTQLAAVRIQKAMKTAGAYVAEGIRDFVISFGCELLKSKMGL